MSMSEFYGKHVLVTGGSRGIGKATVHAFHRVGASITLCGKTQAKRISNRTLALNYDLSDPLNVRHLINTAQQTFGPIDILVNCAGIFGQDRTLELETEDWNKTLAVNLTSYFLTCRKVGDGMIRQRYGKIINVSSIAGLSYSKSGDVAYSVSKAGVIALTKHLAAEFGPYGINVNCVCPGQTNTDMFRSSLGGAEDKDDVVSRIPMGRIAQPEEIAEVILFLASERASYMNGAIVPVSGGQQ